MAKAADVARFHGSRHAHSKRSHTHRQYTWHTIICTRTHTCTHTRTHTHTHMHVHTNGVAATADGALAAAA